MSYVSSLPCNGNLSMHACLCQSWHQAIFGDCTSARKLNRVFVCYRLGKVVAEYIWIGGTEQNLRCKTRVLDKVPTSVDQLPNWNYDGSSTGQAPGMCSALFASKPYLKFGSANLPSQARCVQDNSVVARQPLLPVCQHCIVVRTKSFHVYKFSDCDCILY